MGAFIDNDITENGRLLLSKVHAGGIFEATRIVMGSGYMPAGSTAKTMTDVVSPVISLTINKIKRSNDGMVSYGGVYTNAAITEDFYFREFALYARVKYLDESGAATYDDEVLYSYGNTGDNADLMVKYSTSTVVEKQMYLVSWVGNDTDVSLEIASGLYITAEDSAAADAEVLASAKEYAFTEAKKACAPRNLLDNSDFTNLVNQRGKTEYATATDDKIFDRWSLSGGSGKVQLATVGVTISNEPENSDNLWLCQMLPINTASKKLTLAVCDASGVVSVVSGTATQTEVSGPTNFGYMGFNAFGTTHTRVSIHVRTDVTLRWAALYEGEYTAETLPAYQPKGYSAELAECQRYLVRYGVDGIIHFAYAVAGSNSVANAIVYTPVPMQAKPTYTVISGTPSLVFGDTVYPITALSVNHAHHNILFLGVAITADANSGLSIGGTYPIRLHDAVIEFAAEI